MPNARKPAALTKGHNQSQSELRARIADEERLKGEDDEVNVAPDFIKGWETAEKYYHYIYHLLADVDILSNVDRMGVGALAECLAMMEQSNKAMKNDELMVEQRTKFGVKMVENPAINTHIKFLDRFRTLAVQYGLSPSSRAQLSAMTIGDRSSGNSELEKIINS
ncbi:terminase small subunit [Lactobacillus phage Lenus]|uniref:Terminase small subunit n=1 Tax=Lactobacillus phage Lenus TaxID=2053682 RepID=A0A2H4PBB9_9CAUD|nr:terminase small subunit [Lactobacillus phage Lenus]ATW59535.1 terminase small subunit [Lactobacillus phage Lenus]